MMHQALLWHRAFIILFASPLLGAALLMTRAFAISIIQSDLQPTIGEQTILLTGIQNVPPWWLIAFVLPSTAIWTALFVVYHIHDALRPQQRTLPNIYIYSVSIPTICTSLMLMQFEYTYDLSVALTIFAVVACIICAIIHLSRKIR